MLTYLSIKLPIGTHHNCQLKDYPCN